jgi:hypothetical protein
MQKSQIGDLQHPMLSAPLYISCYNMMKMSRYKYNIDEAIVLWRWNQTSSVFNFSWPWVTAD